MSLSDTINKMNAPSPMTAQSFPATGGMAGGLGSIQVPGAPQYNTNFQGLPFQNLLQSVQQGQNQANTANVQNLQSGMNALTGGFNAGQSSMQNAVNASQNTTSGQLMQLKQQLHNQQGKEQQSAINRGLGNTTVADSMQQMPMQNYNQGVANVQNQGAMRQMQAMQQLGGMQAQGGQAQANLLGQANYQAPNLGQFSNLMASAMQQQAPQKQQNYRQFGSPPTGGMMSLGGGAAPAQSGLSFSDMQNLFNMQQPTYFAGSGVGQPAATPAAPADTGKPGSGYWGSTSNAGLTITPTDNGVMGGGAGGSF